MSGATFNFFDQLSLEKPHSLCLHQKVKDLALLLPKTHITHEKAGFPNQKRIGDRQDWTQESTQQVLGRAVNSSPPHLIFHIQLVPTPPSNSPKARNGDRQVWKQAAGQDGDHWGGAVSRAVSAKPSARWDLSVFEPRSLGRSFWDHRGEAAVSLDKSDKLWSALIVRGRTSFSPVVRSWNRYHLNIVLLQDCTTK